MTADLLSMHKGFLRQSRSAAGLWYKQWRAPKGTCRGVGQTSEPDPACPARENILGTLPVSCSLCFPCPQAPALENWGLMQHQHSAKASSRGSWGHPRDRTEQPLHCSCQLGALCASPCPASPCCCALSKEKPDHRGGYRSWCRAKKLWEEGEMTALLLTKINEIAQDEEYTGDHLKGD